MHSPAGAIDLGKVLGWGVLLVVLCRWRSLLSITVLCQTISLRFI